MKKIICVTVILALLTTYFAVFADSTSTSTDTNTTLDSSRAFTVVATPNLKGLIEDPFNFDFTGITFDEITPVVDTTTNEIVGIYSFGKTSFFNGDGGKGVEIINLLCDPQAISDAFANGGINDISDVHIISGSNMIDGYLIYAKSNGTPYFLTVLSGDTCGVFTDMQVCRYDDFQALCAPQDCTFTVFGNEIDSDPKPYTQYGVTWVPLRVILESLGSTVSWDGDTQTITFTNGDDVYTYCIDPQNKNYGYILKNGQHYDHTKGYEVVNNTTMISSDYFVSTIATIFNVYIRCNPGTYTVDVVENDNPPEQ